MKIILSNCIKIENPTKEIEKFVKEKLTHKNPKYAKMKQMGYYAYGVTKDIKLYTDYEGCLYVPIGFFNDLWKKHPYKQDYLDYSVSKKVDIKSDITLRDYQALSIQAIKKYKTGLFVLPCGLGKTETALQCAYELQQKTIWVTHTTDLVNQAKSRCEAKMKCKTSTITDGKCDTSGDIVFCTIQTLYKMIEKGKVNQNEFGMLIADECHRVASNPNTIQTFRTCIDFFACRYKLGLTATLHRADGLESCITEIIGDVIYEIVKDKDKYKCMYENNSLLEFDVSKFQVPVTVKMVQSDYDISDKKVFASNGGTIQFASLISDLSMNKERNDLVLKHIKMCKGSTIILSDRIEQLNYLCSKVENGVVISGNTPKKERKQALDDTRDGKYKYLFASYSLAKEGLDVPIISNLVMATPVKDFAIVTQSVGRIQRLYEGKNMAYVYDFVDDVGLLFGFYNKRRPTYQKNNWKIENIWLNE